MGRAKLPLVPITKERYKNTTYQKRKAGLFKKLYEFSTLCGVDACVIIYGPKPKRQNGPAKAETWPAEPDEVRRIIRRSAGNTRGKHSLDLSDFLASRKKKIDREIAKQRAKNWRAEYSSWDTRLDRLPETGLRQFLAGLESKIEDVTRLKHMRIGDREAGSNSINVNNYLYQNNYFINPVQTIPMPEYIDDGLMTRAMGKRQEIETTEEQQHRTPCPLPMIAMKMKTIQYHDHDLDQDLESKSPMLLLMNNINNFDGSDQLKNSNFHNYVGFYDNFTATTPLVDSYGGGGDSFQYCSTLPPECAGGGGGGGPYSTNSFQYYTALLGGGDVGSYNNGNLQYYALIGGEGSSNIHAQTDNR